MQFCIILLILSPLSIIISSLTLNGIIDQYKPKNKLDPNKNDLGTIKSPLTSLLVEKDIARINTLTNPLKYGAQYITSGRYIDEQEEFNLKIARLNQFEENNQCTFNRQKFMEYMNIIRDKHNVTLLSWNINLEQEARAVAYNFKNNHKCKYEVGAERAFISELVYSGPERLTEKELLMKWYEPVYAYNFTHIHLDYEVSGGYTMGVLIWDLVKAVGCAKVCCDDRELNICHFNPIIPLVNVFEFRKHIRPNKYFNN